MRGLFCRNQAAPRILSKVYGRSRWPAAVPCPFLKYVPDLRTRSGCSAPCGSPAAPAASAALPPVYQTCPCSFFASHSGARKSLKVYDFRVAFIKILDVSAADKPIGFVRLLGGDIRFIGGSK